MLRLLFICISGNLSSVHSKAEEERSGVKSERTWSHLQSAVSLPFSLSLVLPALYSMFLSICVSLSLPPSHRFLCIVYLCLVSTPFAHSQFPGSTWPLASPQRCFLASVLKLHRKGRGPGLQEEEEQGWQEGHCEQRDQHLVQVDRAPPARLPPRERRQ